MENNATHLKRKDLELIVKQFIGEVLNQDTHEK